MIGPHAPAMAAIAADGLARYLDLHERSRQAFFLDREPHGCLMTGEGELTGATLAAIEPLLGPSVERAELNSDARRVDPAALVATMAAQARAAGVDIRTGTEVRELVRRGDRVTGVLSDDGFAEADVVVVAAGPWSWRVCASLPFDVPVRGVRGWLVVTRPAPFRLRHAVEETFWGAVKKGLVTPTVADLAEGRPAAPVIAGLIQQDSQGRLLLGASLATSASEHPEGQDEAVAAVCRRAAELIPACAALPIAEIRTCRRPLSEDGLPLHGPVPGVDGLVLATGHGSQGITWGGGSGKAVADGIVSGTWDEALLPSRFLLTSVG